jgi:hypothetical protein
MKLISVSEYAIKKGVSVQAVYGKIKRQTIEVRKFGNTYLIVQE